MLKLSYCCILYYYDYISLGWILKGYITVLYILKAGSFSHNEANGLMDLIFHFSLSGRERNLDLDFAFAPCYFITSL